MKRMECIEVCWRVRSRSRRRVLECGIYHTGAAIEVRCGYGGDDLLMSEVVPAVSIGRELAVEWRRIVTARGGFDELPGEGLSRDGDA